MFVGGGGANSVPMLPRYQFDNDRFNLGPGKMSSALVEMPPLLLQLLPSGLLYHWVNELQFGISRGVTRLGLPDSSTAVEFALAFDAKCCRSNSMLVLQIAVVTNDDAMSADPSILE